jgi:hypothetical protein
LSILEEEFGGWPILKNNSNPTANETIIQKLVKIRKIGFKPLIDLHVTLNPKDPQSLMLKVNFKIDTFNSVIFTLKILLFFKIKQPSWLFNKIYYNDTNFVTAYKEYMYKYIFYLNESNVDLQNKINKIFELEKLIAYVLFYLILLKLTISLLNRFQYRAYQTRILNATHHLQI